MTGILVTLTCFRRALEAGRLPIVIEEISHA